LSELRIRVSQRTGWEDSAIKTLVSRLFKKGVLLQERRNVFYYSPAVTREAYTEHSTQLLVDKLYQGSAKNLLASLVSARQLNETDVAELWELLNGGAHHG
jgi:BlaI family penicillinase repressor